MDLNDSSLSGQILSHPSLWRRLSDSNQDHVFSIEIRNYTKIVEAFGLDAARDAFVTLVARVRSVLGSTGVVSPDGEARLGVVFWGVPSQGADRLGHAASDWSEALVRDIVLQPVFTAVGPVHLNVAVSNSARSERCLDNIDGAAGSAVGNPLASDDARRSYRSDMAVLSPVLAAIGGFRETGQVGLTGGVVNVDIGWRPVGMAFAPGGAALYEASLSLIKADGQLASCEQVIAAAERLGLTHWLDHYVVSRAVDELIEARGAVSLLASVSGQTLSDRHFWCGILERLELGGGVACDLIVEVRGSAVAGVVHSISEALATLKRGGCRISFGNFGLGSTSLRDLAAFAPDFVTIDRHFVSEQVRVQYGSEPLSHLVGLARSLGAEVIIDGVDCVNLAGVARETGAALQKGAWCGGQRFTRSWAKMANLGVHHELPDCPVPAL